MKRIVSVILLILSLIVISYENPSRINAQEVPIDNMSIGTFYDEHLVYQMDTGVYSYTNCVPSSVKIMLNLHQIESESVHDIRMKIWYDSYGCMLYDAMGYLETYELTTDWDYIDDESDVCDKLDEWYAMCLVKKNGYNHCVVVVDYTNDGYVILDPLEREVIVRDEIGIVDEFVVYVDRKKPHTVD